ncbi:hypothetical protein HWV62_5490 [Athelia sp. TMB]|nr:hypothetical protein HWV62_5490 [Athelia sp. TMB]
MIDFAALRAILDTDDREAGDDVGKLGMKDSEVTVAYAEQEILRANAYVKTAADLSTKYRKNVQYQLDATKSQVTELESEITASTT